MMVRDRRQARTYERLVTSRASLEAILASDTLAAGAFGSAIALLPLTLGLIVTSARTPGEDQGSGRPL